MRVAPFDAGAASGEGCAPFCVSSPSLGPSRRGAALSCPSCTASPQTRAAGAPAAPAIVSERRATPLLPPSPKPPASRFSRDAPPPGAGFPQSVARPNSWAASRRVAPAGTQAGPALSQCAPEDPPSPASPLVLHSVNPVHKRITLRVACGFGKGQGVVKRVAGAPAEEVSQQGRGGRGPACQSSSWGRQELPWVGDG
jgi:hypothetical protein